MGAARTKAVAGLRRRRLQGVALAVVLGLAAASATLALSILVESRAPFDAAFSAANGAHLVITYAGDANAAELAATAQSPAVTAAAGPWPVARVGLDTGPTAKGHFVIGGLVSGRSTPTEAIDRVTILAGRWWAAPGEAVLSQSSARLLGKGVGDTVTLQPGDLGKVAPAGPGESPAPDTIVTVVGIAQSVSTPDVAVWASPADVATLSPGMAPEQEMLYRVRSPETAAGLSAAAAAIVGDLPPAAVVSTTTWLDIKGGVDRIAQLYVPVLLSFSIFALLAAAFTITNIVSGVDPDELPRHRRDEVDRLHSEPGQRDPPGPDPRPGHDRRDRRRHRRHPGKPADPRRHRGVVRPAGRLDGLDPGHPGRDPRRGRDGNACRDRSRRSGPAGSAPSRRSPTGDRPRHRPERAADACWA